MSPCHPYYTCSYQWLISDNRCRMMTSGHDLNFFFFLMFEDSFLFVFKEGAAQ